MAADSNAAEFWLTFFVTTHRFPSPIASKNSAAESIYSISLCVHRIFLLFFMMLIKNLMDSSLLAHALHYRTAKGLKANPLTSQTQTGVLSQAQ